MTKQSVTGEKARPASGGSRTSPEGLGDAVLWALLDAAPDGILVVDEGGQVRLANYRVEELFGYDRGDLHGMPVETLVPDRARAAHLQPREEVAANPKVRSMGDGRHFVGRRRDGAEFPVDISLSPLVTESRRWVIAAVRDGTERRANEEHRQDAAIAAEEDRIARDLGETVIRGLFGTGLRLQGMRPRLPVGEQTVLDEIVEEIDGCIAEIRGAIFGIRSHGHR